MIDEGVFTSGSNNKKLEADTLENIKDCYKTYVEHICTYNSTDYNAKKKTIRYKYVLKLEHCVNIYNNIFFFYAHTNYTNRSTKT